VSVTRLCRECDFWSLSRAGPGAAGCYHRRARVAGTFTRIPTTKQQKKRVRIAGEERLENLRYASTVKTFTRRLNAAVADGDKDRIAAEHRELVRWIDKAAARGALHRNAAARKKAQAAKLIAGA
jgi:small subunit ribosomal protein S20